MINLKNYFGGAVVISLVDAKDRHAFIDKQFENYFENWRYHYEVRHPHCEAIIKGLISNGAGRMTRPNEFNCARAHYAVVKEAYELGLKNILIMEDDICLLKDESLMKSYLDNMPKNYDVLQFGAFSADPFLKPMLKDKWSLHPDHPAWNASMYALSRRGMLYYLKCQDSFMQVADAPLYIAASLNKNIVNAYLSNIPLHVQENKDAMPSAIRNKENDDIDYTTMNKYEEGIDLEKYFHIDIINNQI